jgi:diguanylate cyclase (GGDEF)-like protein
VTVPPDLLSSPSAADLRAALARPGRLASVAAHGLTRPVRDPDLDSLVSLVAAACGTPMAALTVAVPGRVVIAASHGPTGPGSEQPDSLAPCAHVVASGRPLVVRDLAADARFASSPLVTHAGVAFYAGVPVRDADGHCLGSLRVLDDRPRDLTPEQAHLLEGLAHQARSLLTLRRRTEKLADAVAARQEQAGRLAETVHAQRHDAALLATQTRVLGLVAAGAPLATTLDVLAREVEAAAPGACCSVLVLDTEHGVLRDGAGPSLPDWYREAIDGLPAVDGAGCCGTVAATGRLCVATDVSTDPRWGQYARLAARAGLRACWSSPITGTSGAVLGTFALYYDVSREPAAEHRELVDAWTHLAGVAIERELAQRRLEHVARHDALTGLPNRTALYAAVTDALGRQPADRSAGRTTAVLFLDLDRFKVLNDSLGHSVGDRYLVALAQRLRQRVAAAFPTALLARLGGDEFAVVLPSADSEEALDVAGSLLGTFATPLVVNGRPIRLSGSVGVALAGGSGGSGDSTERTGSTDGTDGDAPTAETLLRDADAAMYEAKRRGHGQVEVFSSRLRRAALNRLDLEVALRAALAAGELSVAYQPEYRLPAGTLAGVEALVRWTRPDGTAVPPGDFIPVAEDSGLVVELGEFVLREACAQAAAWRRKHPAFADAHMWVNLSARQLERDDLPGLVLDVLDATGLPPQRLGLEVTESAVVADVRAARQRLSALTALGIRIAIDDFGTGYSSLSQLIDLPVDVIKIDRSFVSRMPGEAGNRVVAAVVQLAHALGMTTIAEGVEDADQLRALRELHCDEAQGYHLGRPASAEALAPVLAALDRHPALDQGARRSGTAGPGARRWTGTDQALP